MRQTLISLFRRITQSPFLIVFYSFFQEFLRAQCSHSLKQAMRRCRKQAVSLIAIAAPLMSAAGLTRCMEAYLPAKDGTVYVTDLSRTDIVCSGLDETGDCKVVSCVIYLFIYVHTQHIYRKLSNKIEEYKGTAYFIRSAYLLTQAHVHRHLNTRLLI